MPIKGLPIITLAALNNHRSLFSFYWVYTRLFLVSSLSLETKNTVNQSIQRIISTFSYIRTRMNLCTALSVKNIPS